jgi:hypothetical protein
MSVAAFQLRLAAFGFTAQNRTNDNSGSEDDYCEPPKRCRGARRRIFARRAETSSGKPIQLRVFARHLPLRKSYRTLKAESNKRLEMVGKKSGKALLREEGINSFFWPQIVQADSLLQA